MTCTNLLMSIFLEDKRLLTDYSRSILHLLQSLMPQIPQSALLIAGGIALFATSATITSAILRLRSPHSAFRQVNSTEFAQPQETCTTIATDPTPPLNVRSSPVVAPDNLVDTVNNGTQLTVIDRNQGWLRISSPVAGWVYEDRTVTSCVPTTASTTAPDAPVTPADEGTKTLAEATEYYHAGNLNAAIALARTIPADSHAYTTTAAAIVRWEQDWRRAENEFYSSQRASREGRWQDVLSTVQDFPDNRYWRERLTPIVRQAAGKGRQKAEGRGQRAEEKR
jgi:hypothetical protein